MANEAITIRNLLTQFWPVVRVIREEGEPDNMLNAFVQKYVHAGFVKKFYNEIGYKDISSRFFKNFLCIGENDNINEMIGVQSSEVLLSQVLYFPPPNYRFMFEVEGQLQFRDRPMPVSAYGITTLDFDTLVKTNICGKISYFFYNSIGRSNLFKYPKQNSGDTILIQHSVLSDQ